MFIKKEALRKIGRPGDVEMAPSDPPAETWTFRANGSEVADYTIELPADVDALAGSKVIAQNGRAYWEARFICRASKSVILLSIPAALNPAWAIEATEDIMLPTALQAGGVYSPGFVDVSEGFFVIAPVPGALADDQMPNGQQAFAFFDYRV